MNIIPHDKLAERKSTKEYLILNIPLSFIHNSLPHNIENQLQINSTLIFGQIFKSADINSKILPKHFKQGNIHHCFFLPGSDYKSFLSRFTDNLHRHQY